MFWRKYSIAKSIKQGDSFFSDRNVDAAAEKYKEALKRFGSHHNRERAELNLRLALLQLSQNSDLKSLESYFQDALNSFWEVCYTDMERLAQKFHVELSDEVHLTFRKAEIQRLKTFVDSHFQNPQLQRDITVAISIQRGGDELSAIGTRMKLYDVKTKMEIREDNHNGSLTIICDVNFIPPVSITLSPYEIRYGAVNRVLTYDEVKSILADATHLKSKIAEEIEDTMIQVIRAILYFAKNRQLIHEINQLKITVMKGIIAHWIECMEPGFVTSTAKIRKMPIMIHHASNTDFSAISKTPNISDQELRSILNVKKDSVQL